MEEYQQRVVREQVELDQKRSKLSEFMQGNAFDGLSRAEKRRLERQYGYMTLYSNVLTERIENF